MSFHLFLEYSFLFFRKGFVEAKIRVLVHRLEDVQGCTAFPHPYAVSNVGIKDGNPIKENYCYIGLDLETPTQYNLSDVNLS